SHCVRKITLTNGVSMKTTEPSSSGDGARKRARDSAERSAQRSAAQVSQSDHAVSATARRAAESAAWTEPVAMPSAAAILSTAAGTLMQGRAVAREAGRLARELLRISRGSSTVAPAKGDWRFADPTWQENPIYRRVGQA